MHASTPSSLRCTHWKGCQLGFAGRPLLLSFSGTNRGHRLDFVTGPNLNAWPLLALGQRWLRAAAFLARATRGRRQGLGRCSISAARR